MKSISFPSTTEAKFLTLKQSLMIAFFQQMTSNSNFSEKNIHINDFEIIADEANDKMETCRIFFQSFGGSESGTGSSYVWTAHVAVDNSCGNYVIDALKRLTPSKTIQALAAMYKSIEENTSAYNWIKTEKNLTELDRRLFCLLTEPK